MTRRNRWAALGAVVLVLFAVGTVSCGKKHPSQPNTSIDSDGDGITDQDDKCPSVPGDVQHNGCPPPADSDGDGIPDENDQCPTLAGDAQHHGCPWYKVDECSGASPYALYTFHWGTNTPTFYYDSSLPSAWRPYVDYAASTWNAVGTRLQIRKYTSIVSAGQQEDGKCVVSYGPLSGSSLAGTRSWYNSSTHLTTEVDIVLNSSQPMSVGGGPNSFDVWSVLTHEFGHFCGLGHVDDRTHTMYPSIPPGCIIYRTLCDGDRLGLRMQYP
jgi:hypothetical protein